MPSSIQLPVRSFSDQRGEGVAGHDRRAVALEAGVDRDLDRRLLAGGQLHRRAIGAEHEFDRAVAQQQSLLAGRPHALELAGKGAQVVDDIHRGHQNLHRSADRVAVGIDQAVRRKAHLDAVLADQLAAGGGAGQGQRRLPGQHGHGQVAAFRGSGQGLGLELIGVAGLGELQGDRDTALGAHRGAAVGTGACAGRAGAVDSHGHAGQQRARGVANDHPGIDGAERGGTGRHRDGLVHAVHTAAAVVDGQADRETAGGVEHGGDLLPAPALTIAHVPAVGERIGVGVDRGAGIERERHTGDHRGGAGERRHRGDISRRGRRGRHRPAVAIAAATGGKGCGSGHCGEPSCNAGDVDLHDTSPCSGGMASTFGPQDTVDR